MLSHLYWFAKSFHLKTRSCKIFELLPAREIDPAENLQGFWGQWLFLPESASFRKVLQEIQLFKEQILISFTNGNFLAIHNHRTIFNLLYFLFVDDERPVDSHEGFS